jgi:hypothetical protein
MPVRLFQCKREEVMEEWRRYLSEELMGFLLTRYCLDDQIKENKMDRACRIQGFGWES